jgi:hypothetical protein
MYVTILKEIRQQYEWVHTSTTVAERVAKNQYANSDISMPWLSFVMILGSIPLASSILASDNVWVQIPCAIGAVLMALGGFVVYFNDVRYRHAKHFYNEEIIVRDLILSSYISMAMQELEDDEEKKSVMEGIASAYKQARKMIAEEKSS